MKPKPRPVAVSSSRLPYPPKSPPTIAQRIPSQRRRRRSRKTPGGRLRTDRIRSHQDSPRGHQKNHDGHQEHPSPQELGHSPHRPGQERRQGQGGDDPTAIHRLMERPQVSRLAAPAGGHPQSDGGPGSRQSRGGQAEKHPSERAEGRTTQVGRGNSTPRRLPSQQTNHQSAQQDPEGGRQNQLTEPDSLLDELGPNQHCRNPGDEEGHGRREIGGIELGVPIADRPASIPCECLP